MSSNPTVIKGKLRLKGDNSSSSVNKKRKQIESCSSSATTSQMNASHIVNESRTTSSAAEASDTHLTEAQKKFIKRKKEAEDRAIKAMTSKTYRDRIEEFNNKLSTMTEHNDIPRISAAGNG